MTTTSKTLVLAAFAVAVGISLYGGRRVSSLQGQLQALQENQHPLIEQASKARRELDEAVTNLTVAQQQNERLRSDTRDLVGLRGAVPRLRENAQELAQLRDAISATRSDPALEALAQNWMGRVADLKRRLELMPDQKIPELRFLTEQDWLNATRGQLDTDADYRKSMAALREAGQKEFAGLLCQALRAYLKDRDPRLDIAQPSPSDGQQLLLQQFPTSLSQLRPYFQSPVDDTLLQRWEILNGDKLRGLGMPGPVAITQKAAVDEEYDARFGVSLHGTSRNDWRAVSQ